MGDVPNIPPARRSPRQRWWTGLFLASLVALGSTLEAVRLQRRYAPPTAAQERTVGAVVALFGVAFGALALRATPRTARRVRGTKLELALILVATGGACAAAGAATDPAAGLAVNAAGGVSFGNLYYSAWASVGCGAGLLASFLRTERGLDVAGEVRARGPRFRLHAALIVATLIVMGSSAAIYDARCDGEDEEVDWQRSAFCRRAAFGVSAGCIGCVFSFAVVAMRLSCMERENGEVPPNQLVFTVECLSSLILVSFYGFGVAYITSEEGPGAPIGNLFYATWITFGLTFFVALSCFEEFRAAALVHALRAEHGSVVSEEGVDSFSLSERQNTSLDWPNEDMEVAVEPIRQEDNVSRDTGSSTRTPSGSIGEVQIQI